MTYAKLALLVSLGIGEAVFPSVIAVGQEAAVSMSRIPGAINDPLQPSSNRAVQNATMRCWNCYKQPDGSYDCFLIVCPTPPPPNVMLEQ